MQLEETWYAGQTEAKRSGHTTMLKQVPHGLLFPFVLTISPTGSRDRPQSRTITDEPDFRHGRRWPTGFY